jgi:heme-degrading monooxygenase HmoA
MLIRVINWRVKSESIGRIEELNESARQKLADVAGMQRCFSAVDESGNAVVVGIWDSEEAARKAQSAIQAIWASMSEHMSEQPRTAEYKNGYTLK